MSGIRIVCVLGCILCMGAAAYAGSRYQTLMRAHAAMANISVGNDITLSKIQSILSGHPGQQVVMQVMTSNDEINASLNKAYTELLEGWKRFALYEAIFWIVGCLWFLGIFTLTYNAVSAVGPISAA